MQRLLQGEVVGESGVGEGLVEAGYGAAIHFGVLTFAAVHFDDGGLVPKIAGVRVGAAEGLGPVGGEPLDMLGMEAVAEGMRNDVVVHDATMPCVGEAAETVDSAGCFEDGRDGLWLGHTEWVDGAKDVKIMKAVLSLGRCVCKIDLGRAISALEVVARCAMGGWTPGYE